MPLAKRVITYIDGFNLYFGMRESGWKRYYWLNARLLSESLMRPDCELMHVKYFTSRINSPPEKRQRQNTYLEALESTDGLEVLYGQYHDRPFKCPICKGVGTLPAEKQTDVNIATHLLTDAFLDRFDTAILISADSDLCPPIRAVRAQFPQKRVVIGFPPNRTSEHLRKVASATFYINKPLLSRGQFPDTVTRSDGFRLERPRRWG